ncbi:MAG: thiamine pyrophosphate-binding protein [Promethearchaeota archaeon]|nr:MAG: thiamine pyrophosphate-binding protein [Candidatus Lokiarchaeota archaeon]
MILYSFYGMSQQEDFKRKIKPGYGIARFLLERGVKHVFGIPDGHTLGFYDGILQNDGIDHILLNDERSAAFAADAYARVTGMLGVCDAGAAGSMNFPVALTEADGFGSPVLVIVGIIKSNEVLKNIPHDINVEGTLSAITKWTGKVLNAEYLPRFLEYGLKQAINGRPGPAALIISEDVFRFQEVRLDHFIPRTGGGSCSINSCRTSPAQEEIEQAVEMIRKASQPAFFAGAGAIRSRAFSEITELSRMLHAPVFSTISGKGIMLEDDEFYFGTVGLFGEKPNHKFIRKQADLLIVVGNRLTEDDTANFKVPVSTRSTDMIQIDIDPAEIGLSYRPWGVVGDPKAALQGIITLLKQQGITKNSNLQKVMEERKQNVEQLKNKLNQYRQKDRERWINADPIKPQRVLKAISDNLTERDYLVTDASSSARWIGAYYPVKSIGRKIITPRGVGPTGFGVGALIGTCIAADTYYLDSNQPPPKKVLFTGDGGLVNGGITEFETINKLGLDCTIIIINNRSLGFVKFGQAMLYKKRYFQTDRPNTDFAKITEAFGGNGFRVEKLNELDSKIQKAINSNGFNLVDVKIDPWELLPPNSY